MSSQIDRSNLCKKHPLILQMKEYQECCWNNDNLLPAAGVLEQSPISYRDILDAEERMKRFAPFIKKVFPETLPKDGIIESEIKELPKMKDYLEAENQMNIPGRILLKCDSHLPISGSIKARGGIYEVLKTAEDIALSRKLISQEESYEKFAEASIKEVLSQYSIAVGSTGNLGLSIGIMGAAMGFQVTVHMSADARQWKKDKLRSKGVTVIEYREDYSKAVAEGRAQAAKDPMCHFIDDENSKSLFLGYAVAALRLKAQLEQWKIPVDKEHPLVVYLPCGVGGGPGGVAFGLKSVFGDNVQCFFAEPTHSPCMMLGMMTGLHSDICVQDIGLDNVTAADGLAVGRASGFVGKVMENLISGIYTVSDEKMYKMLTKMATLEGIELEPSALAGMEGPVWWAKLQQDFMADNATSAENVTHLVWATGGSMVPKDIMKDYRKKGEQ